MIGLQVAEQARKWIGTPYLHQASVCGAGADCLGLLRGVWRELYGKEPENVPAYTPDWSEHKSDELLWSAAARNLIEKPRHLAAVGDVVLFRMKNRAIAKHLGIQTETQTSPKFVHAYSRHGVVENYLSEAWARRVVARFQFPDRSI